MSWCRFSTVCENGKTSHLYIYEAGGVDIIIAGRKRKNEELAPKVPPFSLISVDPKSYMTAHNARMKWFEENDEWENIDLPYKGEMFSIYDKEELISFLYKLKEIGYNFPSYVFEMAKEWELEDA